MSQRREIVGLQYLRGFCATAVVIDHTAGMAALPKYFGRTLFNYTLEYGALGVDIFFVISGFIISVVALQGGDLAPSLSRASFFAKRFARIVPLMWIAVVSYLVLRMVATNTQIVWINYLRAFTLFPQGEVEPDQIWTLRHELIFYIMFALSFLGRRRSPLLMGLWILSPIALVLARGAFWTTERALDPLGIILDPVNIEFAAGLLVGIAWVKRPMAADWQSPVHPFLLLGLLTAAAIIGAAATGLAFVPIPRVLMLGPMGAGLIWLAVRAHCPDGALSAFGRLLGNASYAVYLFHLHLASAMLAVSAKLMPQAPVGLIIPPIVAAATAGGIVIHLLLEKPLVRRVQQWLGPKPAVPPIVVRG